MEKRPVICEFVGARGVGKSTLAELVSNELRHRQINCNQAAAPRFGASLTSQLRNYVNWLRAYHTISKFCPNTRLQLHKLTERYCGDLQSGWRRFERNSDIVLLSVGIFQTIYMLHVHTAQKDMAAICRVLLRQVRAPDVVVFIEASEHAIEERRKRRGEVRDLRNPSEITPKEREGLQCLKATLQALMAAPTSAMTYVAVVNDGDSDLTVTASRVTDKLLSKRLSGHYVTEPRAAFS